MRQTSEISEQNSKTLFESCHSNSRKTVIKKKSEDVSSIYFEEQSIIQKNQSYDYLYQQPEIPPIVRGTVRKCYNICSCMSSRLIMMLTYNSVKFYPQNQQTFQNPSLTINMSNVKEVRSFKKKDQYFIKLILKNNENLQLRFSNMNICKEWIGYFNQALQFQDYLQEREHYSSKETFNEFIKSINNDSDNKIVKLDDSTVVQKRNFEEPCENTTLLKKKLSIVSLKDFRITHRIGQGAFSTVYKAQKDGKILALKQMSKDKLLFKNQMRYALTQLQVLRVCQGCPFIVPLHYAFQTEDYLYLALSYMNCGNLQQYLNEKGTLNQQQALFILQQLIVAIQYLHQRNILYRDLKPENILLTKDGHILLIDFGLCKQVNSKEQMADTFVGTPLYLIPQRLQGEGKINYKGDIYGVGCVFYALLHGKTPFQGQSLQSIMLNIKSEQVQVRTDINKMSRNFLKETLEKNPQKRLSHMSTHPLFEKIVWQKIIKKQVKSPLKVKQKKLSEYIGIKSVNDQDYTQQNYPNKKVNDWNYTVKV